MNSRFLCSAAASTVLAALIGPAAALAQIIDWDSGDGATSTAWYTDTNWNPDTTSGAWLTTNIAQFNNTGTASAAGIDMGTASLSIGAIEVTSLRTRALTVFNGTAATVGTLTLNQATVNGVANTVLRNAGTSSLTLNNGLGTMGVVLPTAGNNKIVIDAVGAGIRIDSVISGAGGIEMIRNAGSNRLDFGGNNSYDGDLVLTSGRMRVLGTVGGNTIPNGAGKGNVVFNGDSTTQLGLQENETINGLSGGAGSGFVGNDDSNSTNTLTVGDGDATASFGGIIINESSGANGLINLVKIGGGVQTLSGANTYTGTTTINGGTLLVNGTHVGSHLNVANANRTDPYTVNSGGTLGGTGSTAGVVTINGGGTISPGSNSVGTFTLGGLSLAGGILDFQLNATDDTAGSGINDLLINTGALNLTGGATLNVTSGGGLTAGDYDLIQFAGLLTGDASNIALGTIPLASGMLASILIDADSVNLHIAAGQPGDFNGDTKVDAADYVLWRKNPAAFIPADYNTWRSNFGAGSGAGSGVGAGSVPEPGSVMLLVLGATITPWPARRRKATQIGLRGDEQLALDGWRI